MDLHGYGGWCPSKYDWPTWTECEKDCFYGPFSKSYSGTNSNCDCPNKQCTSQHYIKRGVSTLHKAIHKKKGMG